MYFYVVCDKQRRFIRLITHTACDVLNMFMMIAIMETVDKRKERKRYEFINKQKYKW